MKKEFKNINKFSEDIYHRLEKPIYFISCLTTIIGYLFSVLLLYGFFFSDSCIGKALVGLKIEALSFALAFILIPFIVLIFRLHENAKILANGIRVTKDQFSDLYEMNEKYAKIFNLKFVPNIVINSGAKPISDTIPAIKNNTIVLNNVLYEIKRNDSNRRPALEFALLREYAHILLGHKTFRRQVLTIVFQTIPLISNFLSRVETYSADRFAAAILGYDSKDYFCIEATGKFLWEKIDINEVAIGAGAGGFFEEIYAINMKIPPITWRINAIYKMGVFNYKFDEFNFDFSIYDLKNSHGNFWTPPNWLKH